MSDANMMSVSVETKGAARVHVCGAWFEVPQPARYFAMAMRDGALVPVFSNSPEGPWHTAEEIEASKAVPIEPPRKE